VTISPLQIQALIEAELLKIQDQRVLSHVRSHLVVPAAVMRDWDYGKKGESYLCWTVLTTPDSNVGIAYCEFGFGPENPWGLVALSGNMSIGMDCCWFKSFIEAYFDSAASDLPIWRVFKQDDSAYPGVAVTEESDWDSTWEEVYRLRTANPNARYNCDNSIKKLL
jgi:hypothetical protein